MTQRAVLAGGGGFLGRALAQRLAAQGWEVVILTRDPERCHWPESPATIRAVSWNGETAGAWKKELEGAAALVNFTGRSINCVHTLENSREILASRINSVQALGRAAAKAKPPPAVWVQCSAAGYYGDTGDDPREENSPAGRGYLAEVCRQWEAAFSQLELPGTRRVILRLGMVLGREGGALPPLMDLVRRYLGGTAGNGRQYVSWVHRDDLIQILMTVLTRPEFVGVYNACAPEPVTNEELMRTLRAVVGRPWCPRAPELVVRLVARYWLKTEASLILQGQRVVPARLLAAGFDFKFARLSAALADLVDVAQAQAGPGHGRGGAQ